MAFIFFSRGLGALIFRELTIKSHGYFNASFYGILSIYGGTGCGCMSKKKRRNTVKRYKGWGETQSPLF